MNTINFYSVNDDFGEFSNFAPYPVFIGNLVWPTSEHYFQAQKFVDSDYRERIRSVESPMEAAKLGRSRKKKLRTDWESVKDDVMRVALEAKFTQHEDLTELLLSTEFSLIVEHTKNDRYWGDGGDGTGKNVLGKLLVELREELRQR